MFNDRKTQILRTHECCQSSSLIKKVGVLMSRPGNLICIINRAKKICSRFVTHRRSSWASNGMRIFFSLWCLQTLELSARIHNSNINKESNSLCMLVIENNGNPVIDVANHNYCHLIASIKHLSNYDEILEQVELLLNDVHGELYKSRLLREMARLEAMNGNKHASNLLFDKCMKEIKKAKFPDPTLRISEYREIALTQTEVRSFSEALEIAVELQGMKNHRAKKEGDYIVLAVACQYVGIGRIKEAVALKEKVVTEGFQNWLIASVALAQGQMGDVRGSMETQKDIDDISARLSVLVGQEPQRKGIAQLQASKGDLSGAMKTIGLAESACKNLNREYRASHLARIAIAQAQIGDYENVLRTVDRIQDVSQKRSALQEIAMHRASSGDWVSAAKLLVMIDNHLLKVPVLCEIACTQYRDGLHVAASTTLRNAQKIAVRVREQSKPQNNNTGELLQIDRAFAQIACSQAKINAHIESLDTASRYLRGSPLHLAEIAATQARCGQHKTAFSTYNLIPIDSVANLRALLIISRHLTAADEEPQLLAWIEKQPSSYLKAIALIGLYHGRKATEGAIELVPTERE